MLILKTELTNHLIIISTAIIMHFSAFTNLLRIMGWKIMNLRDRDNLRAKNKSTVPKVSFVRRLDCTCIWSSAYPRGHPALKFPATFKDDTSFEIALLPWVQDVVIIIIDTHKVLTRGLTIASRITAYGSFTIPHKFSIPWAHIYLVYMNWTLTMCQGMCKICECSQNTTTIRSLDAGNQSFVFLH